MENNKPNKNVTSFKTANEMKIIANNKNEEKIITEVEIEKMLKDILSQVEISAKSGSYNMTYICCSNKWQKIIGFQPKRLIDLGYKAKIIKFESNHEDNLIQIEWD
ncbi:MAG: hypothetical protein ACREVX_03300 [Clostridium sp.]|uniref:hypothetical protein n=1 Tax=Clostridium sp. TaxID=1506 RepID=UPI003D6C9512